MKAYTWEELEQFWLELKKRYLADPVDSGVRTEIKDWLRGFPREVQGAAALALSLCKWDGQNPVGVVNSISLCGACVAEKMGLWDCDESCPADFHGECGPGDSFEEMYDWLLEKYREAYEQLPPEWKETEREVSL